MKQLCITSAFKSDHVPSCLAAPSLLHNASMKTLCFRACQPPQAYQTECMFKIMPKANLIVCLLHEPG